MQQQLFSRLTNSQQPFLNPAFGFQASFQAAIAQKQQQQQQQQQQLEPNKTKKSSKLAKDEPADLDDGEPDQPEAELDNKGLWDSFSQIGTEMVITKTGR